jgi:hypothetical protein
VIAGVLGFSSSLARLLDDPHLYGWNWNIQVGDQFAPNLRRKRSAWRRARRRKVSRSGTIARLYRGHTFFDTLAIESVKGTVAPTVVEGRAPVTPTEIMLGTRTLEDLGLRRGRHHARSRWAVDRRGCGSWDAAVLPRATATSGWAKARR